MSSYMEVDYGGGRWRHMPVDYPSNSNRGKEAPPPKKVEQITTGAVIQRKKGLGTRLRDSLVSEEREGVFDWVVMEVLVPTTKSLIVDTFGMFTDAFREGVERAIIGDRRSRPSPDRPAGYFNYSRVRKQGPEYGTRSISQRSRTLHEFNDIVLSSRGEAEDVLDHLRELIDRFEVASVADLYELVGITGSFPDNNWGWYDLRSASVRVVRGGYMIVLPRTQPIDPVR